MAEPYPPIEPYDHGLLDAGDGNLVYWEVCGNPDGKPALVVHGGPGSGSGPGNRRYFDPERYRVVLFDQRGCGRSTPHASDPATDMTVNTTYHLIADMERLREHLQPKSYSSRPPDALLAFVRICAHYFSHGAWLQDGELLRHADRLAGIPAVLLHGRLDLGCPLGRPWELAQAWPDARLVVLDDSGHTGSEAMKEEILSTTARFARC